MTTREQQAFEYVEKMGIARHPYLADFIEAVEIFKAGCASQDERIAKLEKALTDIIEEDGHFRMDAGVLDGPYAKIARAALDRASSDNNKENENDT